MSEEKPDKFDELFRNRFEDFSEQPPPESWEIIEKKLLQQGGGLPGNGGVKKMLSGWKGFYLNWVIASLPVIITAVGVWIYTSYQHRTDSQKEVVLQKESASHSAIAGFADSLQEPKSPENLANENDIREEKERVNTYNAPLSGREIKRDSDAATNKDSNATVTGTGRERKLSSKNEKQPIEVIAEKGNQKKQKEKHNASPKEVKELAKQESKRTEIKGEALSNKDTSDGKNETQIRGHNKNQRIVTDSLHTVISKNRNKKQDSLLPSQENKEENKDKVSQRINSRPKEVLAEKLPAGDAIKRPVNEGNPEELTKEENNVAKTNVLDGDVASNEPVAPNKRYTRFLLIKPITLTGIDTKAEPFPKPLSSQVLKDSLKRMDIKPVVYRKNRHGLTTVSIDWLVSPELSYRTFRADSLYYQDSIRQEGITSRKEKDRYKVSFAGGIGLNFHLSERFSIGTGLLFTNVGEKSYSSSKEIVRDTLYITRYDSVSSSYQTIKQVRDKATTKEISSFHNYNYIGVPLSISYFARTKRLSVQLYSGVVLSKLIAPKEGTLYSSYFSEKDSLNRLVTERNAVERRRLTKTNLMYWGGANITYALSDRIRIMAGPSVKYFLFSIYDKNEPIKQKPYSFGLQIGVRYYIRQTTNLKVYP